MITRVSEHLSSRFSGSFGKSTFSDHLLISGHAYKGGPAKLMHKALKEIEISRHRATTNRSILNVFTPDQDLIAELYAVDVDDE